MAWFLKQFWRSQQPSAPDFPTDEVFPVHEFDDSPVNREFLNWTLRFDAVLDADKLRLSLEKLLNIDQWRKLGGRLRSKPDGKLEIHVPRVWSDDRPPIRFSNEPFDVTIGEHPLACKLPRATKRPSVHLGPRTFRSLSVRPGLEIEFAKYLLLDEPMINLHVTSFRDATLVSLAWPHILTDMMGMQGVMKAWCLVLDGREDEVPPLLGVHDDPFSNIGVGQQQQTYAMAHAQLKGLSLIRTGINMLIDMWWWPKMETRIMCLPKQAMNEIKHGGLFEWEMKEEKNLPKGQFVSEGDIVTAWLSRLTCYVQQPSSRQLCIMNLFEARGRLSSFLTEKEQNTSLQPVYVGNATFSSYVEVSIRQVRTSPITEVAAAIRSAIATQTKESQIHALLHDLREWYAKSRGMPPLYGTSGSMFMVVSNWTKMQFLELIDFSQAVVKSERADLTPGKPKHHYYEMLNFPSVGDRNKFQIAGKDHEGNYWVMGTLPAETWQRIEQDTAVTSSSE